MAVSKAKKSEILADLQKTVKDSASIVFVHFHGLTMAQTDEMRKALHAQNVGYTVAKKTLAKKAITEAGFEGTMPELPGEMAVAYGVDALAPAREIQSFAKKFDNRVEIVGGVFEGKIMDKAAMMTIANIPPLQTLRGMFLNIINSPIQRFAIALSAVAAKKS